MHYYEIVRVFSLYKILTPLQVFIKKVVYTMCEEIWLLL